MTTTLGAAATRRPRNVNIWRAAGLLYGDWGTSKAYVVGLAFALAGYSSFWLILGVALLSVLIAFNYMLICKYYPNGGGVYASVRDRSEVLSLIGAFFLVADFGVTAALSALSAFSYLEVSHPVAFSALAICGIGALNFFGPKHTGGLAFLIGGVAIIVLVVLGLFSIPHLGEALHNLRLPSRDPWRLWEGFVGVIVALSGIEAVANTTGVMRLNPGTEKHPRVTKTATPAIFMVMCEVVILTTLFSLALTSISGLTISPEGVFTEGGENIRDYALKYMSEFFVGEVFGAQVGVVFGWILGIVIGLLLLSAVNTAIVGLVALLYAMSSDKELPTPFQKLNNYGVPLLPLLCAAVLPIILVLMVSDIEGLAELYAIGFVGAIATNLGATSTNLKLDLKLRERILMFFSFTIVALIEVTLFFDKPGARNYVILIVLIGLVLRAFTHEARERKEKLQPTTPPTHATPLAIPPKATGQSLMCAVSHPGKTLNYALNKAAKLHVPLYVLFVRTQKFIAENDFDRSYKHDEEAVKVFEHAKKQLEHVYLYYVVTDAPAYTIAEIATQLEPAQLIVTLPKRGTVFQLLQGSLVRELARLLPKTIECVIIP